MWRVFDQTIAKCQFCSTVEDACFVKNAVIQLIGHGGGEDGAAVTGFDQRH